MAPTTASTCPCTTAGRVDAPGPPLRPGVDEHEVEVGERTHDAPESRDAAAAQGALWGRRAADWAAVQEPLFVPVHEAVLAELPKGGSVLDMGCGAGAFCHIASAAGMKVHGVDAAEGLVAIARERTSTGTFCVGDMRFTPYPDGSFDSVVGINSFGHAADQMGVLGEARRVAIAGAVLAIVTWGAPEECDATHLFDALGRVTGRIRRGSDRPADVALEEAVGRAGFTVRSASSVPCPWTYPDDGTALRGVLSAGPFVAAADAVGEERVRKAILDALGRFRGRTGYRLDNTFRLLTAVRAG
ncbi:MAG: class I SAM-dependent methyltransferase [Actinomycetota bacterium]